MAAKGSIAKTLIKKMGNFVKSSYRKNNII